MKWLRQLFRTEQSSSPVPASAIPPKSPFDTPDDVDQLRPDSGSVHRSSPFSRGRSHQPGWAVRPDMGPASTFTVFPFCAAAECTVRTTTGRLR